MNTHRNHYEKLAGLDTRRCFSHGFALNLVQQMTFREEDKRRQHPLASLAGELQGIKSRILVVVFFSLKKSVCVFGFFFFLKLKTAPLDSFYLASLSCCSDFLQ